MSASSKDASVNPPAPGAPVMVKTSMKLPFDMYERVQRAAEVKDEKISLAQLRGAIANLVQSSHAA